MSKPHEIVKTGMSLAGFFRRFPADEAAEAWFAEHRWPDGPRCGHCGSDTVSVVRSRRPMPYRCRKCRCHFSVKTGTPMRDSNLGAQTWLLAIFLIVSNPKGRSSVQLAADLGVCQKTAWHVGHRVRKALADGSLPGFDGPLEADEVYIGGKAANMHRQRRERLGIKPGRSTGHKTAVAGVKDRATERVAARPAPDASAASLTGIVADAARQGARVFTDEWRSYRPLTGMGFDHHTVAHGAREYVRGEVHVNGMENYWSLLKRCYIGTYHYWSPEHLDRYVTEHSFWCNRRKMHVTDRMAEAVELMDGRSLSWRELTECSETRYGETRVAVGSTPVDNTA